MQPNQCAYFAIMHDGLEKVVVFYIENWTDAFNPVLRDLCMNTPMRRLKSTFFNVELGSGLSGHVMI